LVERPIPVKEVFEKARIEPRPGQLETAEKLAELLQQGARILFTAPPGWGKTLTVLAAARACAALPLLWLVRSLEVGWRVGEDAALLGLTTFIAAGREKTCPRAKELGDAVHDYCRIARVRCPYFRLPPPSEVATATDWRALVERARAGGWCAYYAQDYVQADVIVQNYRRRWRVARALVVDEAHNIVNAHERLLKISDVAEAVATLRHHAASDRLVRQAEGLLKYLLARAEGDVDARALGLDIDELKRLYFTLLVEDEEAAKRLKPLILLEYPTYVDAERIKVYQPSARPQWRPAVFVTATPLSVLSEFVDVEIRVPWERKFPGMLVKGLSTKFEEFDRKMALEYKRLIIAVARTFKRIVVFAAERVAAHLRALATYYEQLPSEGWEGVALFKYRGRFSEGVDIPAFNSAVVLAGAPFLPPEVSRRLARAFGIPARVAIDGPMLATVVQSVGRAWRDPAAEPPFVFLADERFERYRDDLSRFIEIKEEKDISSL